MPASSRAIREHTSFSSGEALAAEAALADPLDRDREASGTEGQAQGPRKPMPLLLHQDPFLVGAGGDGASVLPPVVSFQPGIGHGDQQIKIIFILFS